MATLAERISQLTDPTPSFHDPEDDDDDTRAKLLNKPGDDEPVVTSSSRLRKQTAGLLADEDPRYAGRRISRSRLQDDSSMQEIKVPNESDSESEESADAIESEEEEEEDDAGEEEDETDEDLAEFRDKMKLQRGKAKPEEFQFDDDGDYGQYAGDSDEEMDSEEDDESGEEDSEDEEDGEDDEDDDEEGVPLSSQLDDTEDGGGMKAFSESVMKEEVAKGKAVRTQLGLWDSMLKCRIELQKMLTVVNRLPQPDSWNLFWEEGGDQYQRLVLEGQKNLQNLLEQLVELQTALLLQNRETKHIAEEERSTGAPAKAPKKELTIDDDDEEITSESEAESEKEEEKKPEEIPKPGLSRKRKWSEYPEFLAKRHASFQTYRNETIQKWADKTRVASGRISKSFSSTDHSVVRQIEKILSDKERLVRRTQLKRSDYTVLGKRVKEVEEEEEKNNSEPEPDPEPESRLPNREHLKDYDSEIFDDDDFYHQLLRELIERKTSDISDPVALSRQWLEIQKLRNRAKKNVDTKASKGRKVRYHVHSKLVNFMAPMETGTWSDEAKDDLFKSLFGNTQST